MSSFDAQPQTAVTPPRMDSLPGSSASMVRSRASDSSAAAIASSGLPSASCTGARRLSTRAISRWATASCGASRRIWRSRSRLAR